MARATRIALDMALEASKFLKSSSVIAWQYVKTEAVPPLTLNFFHGPGGKKLENIVSQATDNFIAGIQNRIQQLELENMREIANKKAEVKAIQEKIKAEAKIKSEEVKKKKAVSKEAKVKQKTDAHKVQAKETKKFTPQTNKKVKKANKSTPKKKNLPKRKEAKKHRREDKKGIPPKAKNK